MQSVVTKLLLVGLAWCLLIGVAAASKNVIDGHYVSPLGNFTTPVPAWKNLKVQEHNDQDFVIAAFLDRDPALPASMWSIVSLRLSPDMLPEVAKIERRDEIYQRFLVGFALPYVFQNVAPNSTLSNGAFLGEGDSRSLFAVVNIPEGHTYLRNPKKKKQDDSVSGLLVFHHGSFMYLIRQEMKSITNADITPAALSAKDLENVQGQLEKIKATISFSGDQALPNEPG